MTQPSQEAVGSESAPVDAKADATQTFEDMADTFFEDDEEEPAPVEGEELTDELAEDDVELEEEADDLPPIEAPVSWDAEAKAKFADLPRELQETVTKREAERERFVQQKSQEAVRAKQEVEQVAHQQLATIERQYAEQYQQIAQQFDVPEPDMSLLATDPQTYAYQARQYQQAQAQRHQMQQQAQYYAQQAQAREAQAEQAYMAEQHKIIVEHFPEYADPTTGPKFQQELSAVARELGYPPELIGQARAQDILAMRKVAELKVKADRYDALNAKKMERVRAAKKLPPVAKPGVAVASDQVRANRASQAWDRAKAGKNMSEKAEGFAEWASNAGIL